MIESIETILIYKLPRLGREELERMFDLAAFRHTAVHREAFTEGEKKGKREGKREGKLDAVPLLLALGATEEQIAAELALSLDEVRQAARPRTKKTSSRKTGTRRAQQPGE